MHSNTPITTASSNEIAEKTAANLLILRCVQVSASRVLDCETILNYRLFRMEEILPKQFPHAQRNLSKTSMVARSTSPQGGKLLILRPTLPLHHTDAVNVQRICLQYAIDLIPSNAHSNGTSKSNVLQQLEKASHLPAIRASSSSSGAANQTPSHRFSTKDKSNTSRNPVRPYQQRRSDGAVWSHSFDETDWLETH